MGNINVKIEMIENGFIVSVYNGDSCSRGSYSIYCATWKAVNEAIEQWKNKFAKWLNEYDPTGYNPTEEKIE